mmetsp:Transcript_3168/g.5758  ORF Transcript_3168/g.5758 Transcript_3168/m.5758 type:complete len:502 (-) Transcript_3168:24-1529(-)
MIHTFEIQVQNEMCLDPINCSPADRFLDVSGNRDGTVKATDDRTLEIIGSQSVNKISRDEQISHPESCFSAGRSGSQKMSLIPKAISTVPATSLILTHNMMSLPTTTPRKTPDKIKSSSVKGKIKKNSSSERLQRSRERNRMHARKTRQRKKEHINVLQERAEELKNDQIQLKLTINEKITANILLGMFTTCDAKLSCGEGTVPVDSKVEELLTRPVEDIPDASKIPELPALILPGQHSGKKGGSSSLDAPDTSFDAQHADLPNDGIDYDLLGKDRAQCTPAELDKIRRERNRMHAKRTRDRKRIFMEEMEDMIKLLVTENEVLHHHLDSLNGECGASSSTGTPSLSSPSIHPASPTAPPPLALDEVAFPSETPVSVPVPTTTPPPSSQSSKSKTCLSSEDQAHAQRITVDQIKSLLAAAGTYDTNRKNAMGMWTISSVASAVSASNSNSEKWPDDASSLSNGSSTGHPHKRQRLENGAQSTRLIVPSSITTSTQSPVSAS